MPCRLTQATRCVVVDPVSVAPSATFVDRLVDQAKHHIYDLVYVSQITYLTQVGPQCDASVRQSDSSFLAWAGQLPATLT